MALIPQGLLIIAIIISLIWTTSAASPTTFCKCTCFSNSTIIPLNSEASHSANPHQLFLNRDAAPEDSKQPTKGRRIKNCNDCNRQFCLDYNLPICDKAKVEDVFTTCFQRDSRKDEAVVFIFIFATAGLLIYAAIRPWAEKWLKAARERSSYIPVRNELER